MLMRGYTLFEESFYKDNKDLLEFIRIKRFYKNSGDDEDDQKINDANNNNNNKSNNFSNETELMRNNKKFLPKIDSNLNFQNARSLRKRINSPTYKLLCEVNEKFKALGYRLSPTLLITSREKPLEFYESTEKQFIIDSTKKNLVQFDGIKPTINEETHKIKENSNKKKLEIWMPNILTEESETDEDCDQEENNKKIKSDNNTSNKNKQGTILEENEQDEESSGNSQAEFNEKYEKNVFRSKPYLKNNIKSIQAKNIYKLVNNNNNINGNNNKLVTSSTANILGLKSQIDAITDDSKNVDSLFPIFVDQRYKIKTDKNNIDLNLINLDNKANQDTASPRLGNQSTRSTTSKGITLKQVNATKDDTNSEIIKTKMFSLDENEIENNNNTRSKVNKPLLPPIFNNFDVDTNNVSNNPNGINDMTICSYRLSRITEPLARTTKSLIDNELDEMLSNKKQLQQQYDDFRQKIIDLRSTDNSNLSAAITPLRMTRDKNGEVKPNPNKVESSLSSNYSNNSIAAKLKYSKRIKESSFIKESKNTKIGNFAAELKATDHGLKQADSLLVNYLSKSQVFNSTNLSRFNTDSLIKLQQQPPQRTLLRNPSFYSAQENNQQDPKRQIPSLHHPVKSKNQPFNKPKIQSQK